MKFSKYKCYGLKCCYVSIDNPDEKDIELAMLEMLKIIGSDYYTFNQRLELDYNQQANYEVFVVIHPNTITVELAARIDENQTLPLYSTFYNRAQKKWQSQCYSGSDAITQVNLENALHENAQDNERRCKGLNQCNSLNPKIIINTKIAIHYDRKKLTTSICPMLAESLAFFRQYVIHRNTAYVFGASVLTSLCCSTMPVKNLTKDIAIGVAVVFSLLSCIAKIFHTAIETNYDEKSKKEMGVRIAGLILFNLAVTLPITYLSQALFIGLGSSILDASSGALLLAFIANIAVNHVYDKHVDDVSPVVTAFLVSFTQPTQQR